MMKTRTFGADHIGLTVPDLDAARDFFIDALGFEQVGEQPDYPAVFVSDGQIMITLWRVKDSENSVPFDRQSNIGLHHLALKAGSIEELEVLAMELAEREDVSIEFKPEALGASDLKHMMCRIPGNIRLELISR